MGLVELLICPANLHGTVAQVGRLIVPRKHGAQTLVARADRISRTSLHGWGREHTTIYAKPAPGTPESRWGDKDLMAVNENYAVLNHKMLQKGRIQLGWPPRRQLELAYTPTVG